MSQHATPREVVDAYFAAMRRGRDAHHDLVALFAPDAEYTEPFAGAPRTHHGREAIDAALGASWDQSPPDLELIVHRVDVEGQEVRAAWSCRSPVFPAPVEGRDTYLIEAGRIRRLVTEILG